MQHHATIIVDQGYDLRPMVYGSRVQNLVQGYGIGSFEIIFLPILFPQWKVYSFPATKGLFQMDGVHL